MGDVGATGQRVSMKQHRPTAVPSLPASLEGRALTLARTLWLLLLGTFVSVAVAGHVRGLAQPELVALPALQVIFDQYGLPPRMMMVAALMIPLAVVFGVCGLVFWRRSHDPMALLFTGTIAAVYTYISRSVSVFLDHPVLWVVTPATFALGVIGVAVVLALFPDGRCVPRWGRWLPLGTVVLVAVHPTVGRDLQHLIEGRSGVSSAAGWWLAVWGGSAAAGFVAQRYRYRHVSSVTQRQQAAWVLVPLGFGTAVIGVSLVVVTLLPGLERWLGWMLLAMVPVGIVIPLALGNAVLRYRLYDLDIVLSRTVTYAIVVLCLAAVYGVGVVGLGALMVEVLPESSGELPVAASTLAAIALFRPLRARVRRTIDRRFARTHYLAAREVEAFSQRLRDEVDVVAVLLQLRTTTAAAVAPATLSVWLADGRAAPARDNPSGGPGLVVRSPLSDAERRFVAGDATVP
jgi:hypothetical protein